MNYIRIAKDTVAITKAGYYECNQSKIKLSQDGHREYSEVTVYSPERLEKLKHNPPTVNPGHGCRFKVSDLDSFEAAKEFKLPLVMNFANAHHPGGGFLLGATAQEEALCRCSTLYASIASEQAKEMYQFNTRHLSTVDSHYMLLSPNVYVFRDRRCELLRNPYRVAVITVPAPNKRGKALLTRQSTLEQVMKERLRYMFLVAAQNDYKTLILGAWGCGAFGHHAKEVAGYFYEVLVAENYQQYFDNISFAILHSEKNLTAFQEVFMKETEHKN